MRLKASVIAAGILLATTIAGFSQPTITSLRLSGQAATIYDASHLYLSNSVSPGAKITFTVTASGLAPLNYQWQFNQNDLPGQTNRTLLFPSVDLTNAGDYTVVVTNAAGSTNRTATLTVDPTFSKIISGAIVTDVDYSPGGTWGDYDNNGFLDLLAYNGMDGIAYTPFLYRNNGDGTFTKVNTSPLTSTLLESHSACWGDYDNDGNLDLFVSSTGRTV